MDPQALACVLIVGLFLLVGIVGLLRNVASHDNSATKSDDLPPVEFVPRVPLPDHGSYVETLVLESVDGGRTSAGPSHVARSQR